MIPIRQFDGPAFERAPVRDLHWQPGSLANKVPESNWLGMNDPMNDRAVFLVAYLERALIHRIVKLYHIFPTYALLPSKPVARNDSLNINHESPRIKKRKSQQETEANVSQPLLARFA